MCLPAEPSAYARLLYATLHSLDELACATVLIERPPTQSELAAVVFSSRESVAREMGRMRKAGVLLRVKRSLHVPSVERLRDYVEAASP